MTNIDVSVVKVSKNFGNFQALDSVSLEVPQGSFFSILGPSGSGKTTLLRIICGFERPSSGEVYIGGVLANNIPPNKRRTNLVFQNLALFPMMNVAGNIAYGLKQQNVPGTEIKEKVSNVLERVGLEGMEERRVEQLSGGQKQRVALARCLVLNPTVLLLDEPLGALDLKLRESMKFELKRLQIKTGTTFIYVTHDQSEALAMSDQIAVINHGIFEQVGSPLDIYRKPSSHFVATFVGDNNCWPGMVQSITGDHCEMMVGPLKLSAAMGEPLEDHHEADVFIRPETIKILPDSSNADLKGVVREIVFDGAYSRIRVKATSGEREFEVKVTVAQSEDAPTVVINDHVSLLLEKGSAIAFRRPKSALAAGYGGLE
jgi:spermidine/putrescine transport system ATP-binding protein